MLTESIDPVAYNEFDLDHPPQRVVSLVPSLTESLFDLGLGGHLVGVTDYCIYPAQPLKALPHLGGTKNPRIAEILELKPDLVLANQEENTPAAVRALEQAGVKVWVSFPKTVRESMKVLHSLAAIFNNQLAYQRLDTLDRAVEMLESSREDMPGCSYFCPIWRDETGVGQVWWMTFNRDTYSSDLLYWMGGENIFADRVRRYPLEADLGEAQIDSMGVRDRRYPRLSMEEITLKNPEMVLLPSEPFEFAEVHRQEMINLFPQVEAVKNMRVYLVDGSLITWHGTRLAKAISELQFYFN